MEKFGFKIQTRTGTTVDRLVVHAVDQAAAVRRGQRRQRAAHVVGARLQVQRRGHEGGARGPHGEPFRSNRHPA